MVLKSVWRSALVVVLLLSPAVALAATGELPPEPNSPAYLRAITADGDVRIGRSGRVDGDVHGNARVAVDNDTVVEGAVTAGGEIENEGSVTRSVRSYVPASPLPAFPDLDAVRAGATRLFEGDTHFRDETLSGVVFVDGDVRWTGVLRGAGFLVTTGSVEFEPVEPGQGDSLLDPAARPSVFAAREIRVGRHRSFRGLLFAAGSVRVEDDAALDGVVVAGGEVKLGDRVRIRRTEAVDGTPPEIRHLSPADGVWIAATTPPVSAVFRDAGVGVDTASVVLRVDGVDRTGEAVVTDAGFLWTPATPLSEGEHGLELSLRDRAGNRASVTTSFFVDTLAPTVTLSRPANGAVLRTGETALTGTVVDESGRVEVRVGDLPTTVSTGGPFRVAARVVPGFQRFEIEAVDRAGNVGRAGLAVTGISAADAVAPTVRIVSPADEAWVFTDRPEIELAYASPVGVDADSLVITADGVFVPTACELGFDGGRCTLSSALGGGPVTLEARLVDRLGQAGSATARVRVDAVPVTVRFTAPDSGVVVGDAEIEVRGEAAEDVVSVVVAGVEATLTGGAFAARVPLRTGRNRVTAVAARANGKTGHAHHTVTRDVDPPILRIVAPADGTVLDAETLTVAGLVNDLTVDGPEPRVFVAGVEAEVANGGFVVTGIPLTPGVQTLEAVARDAAGNEATAAVRVERRAAAGAGLRAAGGDGQTGIVETPLAEPLTVQAFDRSGLPLAGRRVTFRVVRGGGLLARPGDSGGERSVQVVTDGAGLARAALTLGKTAGAGGHRVEASGVGLPGTAQFVASARPGDPVRVLLGTGDNQRGAVFQPLPEPLEALVVDDHGNPVAGVPVDFAVVRGGGVLEGSGPALTRTTAADGRTRVELTAGADTSVGGQVVTASLTDAVTPPATFVATAWVPGDPAATRLTGVVLDNGFTAIPGARVFVVHDDAETVTDAAGTFELTGVPVGRIHLRIEPDSSPRPETFPPLEFELTTVAGRVNTVGMPISIPSLDGARVAEVGGPRDVTLTMPGVDGFSLTVFAGSTTFPDGSPTGSLSVSQVHLDKVPMPPPNGTFFMPPAWTLQPAGVVFDPPARIVIPNDGLEPGRTIDIFQFDHDLNAFVDVAKGEVVEDASVIVSDPGFGIRRSGWGGCGQPPPPSTETEEEDPCDSAAEDARDIADRIPKGDPTKIFAEIQACIAENGCQQKEQFEQKAWPGKVMRKFIDDWKNLSGDWPEVLGVCYGMRTAVRTNPMIPDGIDNLMCAGYMAQHHIRVDLIDALVMEGCGTNADWDRFRGEIENCVDETLPPGASHIARKTVVLLRDKIRSQCFEARGGR